MSVHNARNLKNTRSRAATAALAVLLAASLGACASMPEPPAQQLQAAELAITNAEQAGVADYAAPELGRARDKLAGARSAVEREEMVLAANLAEESKVEADLASANSEMLKAREINEEMQDSIDTLKQELQRNSGARQ
jgi:ribosome-associated translation inhibitor RaiA